MKKAFQPIRTDMNTIKTMTELHNLFSKITSQREARELITNIVHNAIADIQDEKIEFTSEELEKRINIKLNDFLEVIKKTHAA